MPVRHRITDLYHASIISILGEPKKSTPGANEEKFFGRPLQSCQNFGSIPPQNKVTREGGKAPVVGGQRDRFSHLGDG